MRRIVFLIIALFTMWGARPPTTAANPLSPQTAIEAAYVAPTGDPWPPANEVNYTPPLVATQPKDENFVIVSSIQQLKETNRSPSGGLAR